MNLLEAITNFGDDWKRVAHQVVGRTDKECVAHFLELPFGYQLKPPVDAQCESETVASSKSSKRMCLTPLTDANNPIMAQADFLSALAGTEVAQAAAQAALTSFPMFTNQLELITSHFQGIHCSKMLLLHPMVVMLQILSKDLYCVQIYSLRRKNQTWKKLFLRL